MTKVAISILGILCSMSTVHQHFENLKSIELLNQSKICDGCQLIRSLVSSRLAQRLSSSRKGDDIRGIFAMNI